MVCDQSNHAIEQYFHVVPFIMLYKVVLTCYVDKTPVCDSTFFKFYEFYYACKIESNLYSCIQNRFFLQYH